MSLFEQLSNEMKNAMRAKDKPRLGVIRMALSAIKQAQIDGQKDVTDDDIIALITKMIKQRKESAAMYTDGGRPEQAASELAETVVLEEFLPQALTADEIKALIEQAIADTGAASMADMGKVMGVLKPKMQGRADLGQVSGQVRAALNA
ncbi:GatB/YqeY domain-containing protein [Thalassotalea sp. HSM 43]|uniref:GatB/YqeY domain-containing protein n=1 Tax=Thalassotalea sp. HSM 43 TaxID=2552945 RepID=UPI0010806514|nr:GatB/YqeY domain-containing protein [Thalassotalea sp. HSM 43]QBY03723.1 GatB/YqeY domain-containing protein [Thalassotalea sp. HSM 43]